MKKHLFLLVFVGLVIFSQAQDKLFTPEEIASNRKLYPTGLSNLQWRGNSGQFTWQDATSLIAGNVEREKNDTLIRLTDLNSLLTESGAEGLKRFPWIQWVDENACSFSTGTDWYLLSLPEKKLSNIFKVPDNSANHETSPGNRYIAYTIDNNLFIHNGKEQLAVTREDNKGIVSGQSVHRNEFGISKGTFWSPSGRLLAFYRMDETMVTEYPLVDVTERIARQI